MKRFFLIATMALFLVSCGNSYIENYEEICADAKEQIDAAVSVKEVMSITKQMRKELAELNEEFPEEAQKYRSAGNKEDDAYKIVQRRLRAFNGAQAAAAAKRRELLNKK